MTQPSAVAARTLGGVPAQSIAQALPYVNWIVLATLAVGTFAQVALVREATDATRGYVGFTAFCAAAFAGLALLSDLGLAAPSGTTITQSPPELETARRAGLAAFAVLGLAYVIAIAQRRRTLPLASLTLMAAVVAFVAAALGWSARPADAVPLLVQLAVLSAAFGGALAALILGHWYLVTPRLSERPLVFLTRVLTLVVGLQLALFVVWSTLGGGPAQAGFEALTGPSALYAWLRLLVSLLFPLALAWMALRTAMTRSMESATGLLYLCLAAVAAGTIVAAALYVSAGILV